ncbi:T9SS type A sorting domain-containing protein [Hymenobacter sp. BT683]|uniref:T9SS type A sorting domain-containing protein n=1 Tax=Hymenobacter jeongseonensis TaxID=2791027 RepID=A0ABS0IE86_9BACT|nr:T9SS type A sorting domain-containing protein [Hymenobacter jeongseonensis]MBF9236657.1 T9SS type A sorting domain-containing protein [Hymenobacter jeongseonensis]
MLTVGLLVLSYESRAQDPGVGGTVANFEVDSDFKSGIVPSWWSTTNYTNYASRYGFDWSQGPGTAGRAVLKQEGGISVPGVTADRRSMWQEDGNWGSNSAKAEVASFAGSSNKNGNNIAAGKSPYALQLGGSGPQKNDITNTYLHAREDAQGHTWLFFGAETRATNGNSYLDFEYNQNGVTVTNTQLIGNGPVNGRTVGDFLLVINYTGGGNRPVVGVRTWLASGAWSNEISLSSTTLKAFITTNTGSIEPVAPNKAFTSDGAYTNTVMALQFVEGGIDVSAIPELNNLDKCNPAATITVKTRSSSSYTAELKDLDVLSFPLTPAATAAVNAVPAQCKDASGTTAFSVSGTYSNGTPSWSVSSGGTLANPVYNPDGTATVTVNVLNTTTTAVRVTLTTSSTNSSCPTASNYRDLILNPTPVGTNTTMASCPTAISGTTAVFDLTSKNGTVTGGAAGVTVAGWYETYTAATNAFTNPIATPATYTSGSKTVFAKLSTTDGCIGVANNTLSVTASPVGTNTSMSSCPASIGGTTAVFDLNSKNSTVTGGAAGVTVVGWYETYTAATNAFTNLIATPAAYTSGSKTVYAKLSGAAPLNCAGVANNALSVTASPAGANTSMSTCPTTAGGSTGVFDLTSKNSVVTGGVSGVTVVGWYETYTAATSAFANPIATPATYTSGSKTVYAKLSGAAPLNCVGVANNVLSLTASPLRPNVTITEPKLCGPTTATLTVPGSVSGATYTLVNGGATTSKTGTGNDLNFGGLAAGSGFSITVTLEGCESAPTTCENYTTPAAKAVIIDAQSLSAPLQGRIQTEAYPNPTSKDATINFSVPKSGHVVVSVYDALGRQVTTLFDGEAAAGEPKTVVLKGEHLGTGNYYYRIVANGQTKTSRISLAK